MDVIAHRKHPQSIIDNAYESCGSIAGTSFSPTVIIMEMSFTWALHVLFSILENYPLSFVIILCFAHGRYEPILNSENPSQIC